MQSDAGDLPSIAPAQVIKHLLDLGVPRTAAPETKESFEIHYFDLSSLKIRSSRFTSVVFSRKPPRTTELSLDDVDELISQSESALATRVHTPGERRDEDGFVVLLQIGNLPSAVRARRSLPRHPRIVILDRSDCRSIQQSAKPSDALRIISKACALALGPLE